MVYPRQCWTSFGITKLVSEASLTLTLALFMNINFKKFTWMLRKSLYAPINVKPAGKGGWRNQGMAWGFDCLCWPWVWHLTDLVLPGEGIFESFFARCGDIWLPTRTKKTETEHMFPASTLHACAVRFEKIRKSWRPMRTSEGWVDFTVLSSNFVCFSVFLINWTS